MGVEIVLPIGFPDKIFGKGVLRGGVPAGMNRLPQDLTLLVVVLELLGDPLLLALLDMLLLGGVPHEDRLLEGLLLELRKVLIGDREVLVGIGHLQGRKSPHRRRILHCMESARRLVPSGGAWGGYPLPP